jgi:hypothetical protein
MCVIMCSNTSKPTPAMMEAGHEKNPWGAGVAWQEKDKKGETWMRWVKGITEVGDVIKLVEKLTPPLVVHFRIPTEGMNDISLTHPFPVDGDVSLAFEGKTKSPLLFHNGGWGNWRNFSLETAMKTGRKLPSDGMLSDSRMMAWNVDFYGPGLLYLINEKVILFGVEGIQSFGLKDSGGWEYDRETKVWTSNPFWKSCLKGTHTTSNNTGGSGGSRDATGFRPHRQLGSGTPAVGQGGTEPQQVEGREADVQARVESLREVIGKDGKPAIRRSLTTDPEFLAEVRKLGDVETSTMSHAWATRRLIQHRGEGLVM